MKLFESMIHTRWFSRCW